MRALTLHQPWAAGIVYAGKNVENRTWHPGGYRGPVMIHAGQRADREAMADSPADLPRKRVFGAVIGVALLVDAHTCNGECSQWADPGLCHWQLATAYPLTEPVAAPGARRLWVPDGELCRRVQRQLPDTIPHFSTAGGER